MKFRFIYRSLLPLLALAVLAVTSMAEDLRSPASLPLDGERFRAAPETARCSVRNDANGWWLVDPNGERFFSLGVCMFNQGTDKAKHDPARPSYAALRHYETADAWVNSSLRRLQAWGFTTVGGWSDYGAVRRAGEKQWWLTPVLHLGSTSGAPWFDMWDEKIIRRIEEVAVKNMGPLIGDPRVLGFYSDNELGWWNAILWKMTLEHRAQSGQRQRLVSLVREVYANDWNALAKDFDAENATSWEELERGGMLWLRPGSNGIHTIRRFLRLVADRYYQLMRDTIRRLDPDALYFGDRYQSFYYPEVALASRQYVDVVSTNLNASWNDGTFINSYLETLHKLTGKPLIVSEFYMAAKQNRSGNKNAVGGFPQVQTQPERAEALANTLRELASRPYVVGADWFQYYDEPPHGRRLDGEDYNFGLVDIHDQPYDEVTAAFAALDLTELKLAAESRRPDTIHGVPPAPIDPMGEFHYMHALKRWDRRRGFIHPVTERPVGDLYACWSPTALYLATFVVDIIEPDYYCDSEVPEIDRATWTVRVNGREPIKARIGAGKEPAITDPTVRIKSLSGTYHDVRCITVIELSAKYFGKKSLAPGERVALDTSFVTHGSAYRVDWKGEFSLHE